MAVLSALGSFFRSSGKWLVIILGAVAGVLGLLWWREKKARRAAETERDAAEARFELARKAVETEARAAAEQRRIADELAEEKERNRVESERLRAEAERLRRERDAERARIAELDPDALTDALTTSLGHEP